MVSGLAAMEMYSWYVSPRVKDANSEFIIKLIRNARGAIAAETSDKS